jgi:hypothetical protein
VVTTRSAITLERNAPASPETVRVYAGWLACAYTGVHRQRCDARAAGRRPKSQAEGAMTGAALTKKPPSVSPSSTCEELAISARNLRSRSRARRR